MRRIRGAIGMGFTWGFVWSFVGAIPRWIFGFNTDAPLPLVFGVLGFVAGVTFAMLLMLTEGRRRFDQMSMPRFAVWGALGGLLLSGVFARIASISGADLRVLAATLAFASAACASGSLALARRAAIRELQEQTSSHDARVRARSH